MFKALGGTIPPNEVIPADTLVTFDFSLHSEDPPLVTPIHSQLAHSTVYPQQAYPMGHLQSYSVSYIQPPVYPYPGPAPSVSQYPSYQQPHHVVKPQYNAYQSQFKAPSNSSRYPAYQQYPQLREYQQPVPVQSNSYVVSTPNMMPSPSQSSLAHSQYHAQSRSNQPSRTYPTTSLTGSQTQAPQNGK